MIGQVGRPHGLGGAFFVSGRKEAIDPKYGELKIGPSLAQATTVKVETSAMQSGRPLLKCSLAFDRTTAAQITGHLIFADRRHIQAQRGDDMLWSDLERAEVLDCEGVVIGRIHHVYNAGSSDIIEVTDGIRSVDIPLIPDYLAGDDALATGADGRFQLHLKVPRSTFDDVWNDQTKDRPASEPSDA